MKCEVILRVDLEHISFQYLIDTVSLIYVNTIYNNLTIGDWVNNVERSQKNEGGK